MTVLVSTQVYATSSSVFHMAHKGVTARRWFPTCAAAREAGLRGCLVCRPEKRSEEG